MFLEHNAPRGGPAASSRHPLADRDDLLLVHVTHFNDLMWDCGSTATAVVEHGVVDPGHRYTGALAAAAVCVNEPIRRGRVTGTDLLPRFAEAAPLDVFGMGTDGLGAHLGCAGVRTVGDLPQDRLHDEMARRRVYLHPLRWTSLGLSLVEAMHLGMPVVALATTEAHEAVPPGTGICSRTSTGWCASCGRWSPTRTAPGSWARRAGRTSGTGTGWTGSSPAGTTSSAEPWTAPTGGDARRRRSCDEEVTPVRIAMVSEHASPLAAVGGVDAGGQNVHVLELAPRWPARGTRSRSGPAAKTTAPPDTVPLAPA